MLDIKQDMEVDIKGKFQVKSADSSLLSSDGSGSGIGIGSGSGGGTVGKRTPLRLPLYQDTEQDIMIFALEYLPFKHSHYMALETAVGPVCVTIRRKTSTTDDDDEQLLVMIRTALGTEHLKVSLASIERPPWYDKFLFYKWPTIGNVLTTASHPLAKASFKRIKGHGLGAALLRLDERLVIGSHKVGIVFSGLNQSNFDEMLLNGPDDVSPQFWRFLRFLGQQIDLRGWTGFSGGLDTINDLAGQTTFYTKWQQLEFLFHVGPLIPSLSSDPQQIDRKKHIGNDIVLIVFRHPGAPLIELSSLHSKQIHVVIVVTPRTLDYHNYEFDMIIFKHKQMPDVPSFAGDDQPLSVNNTTTHRDLFLAKVLMAERTSYKAPDFSLLFNRTRAAMLRELAHEFLYR